MKKLRVKGMNKVIPKFWPGDNVSVLNPRTRRKEPGRVQCIEIGNWGGLAILLP